MIRAMASVLGVASAARGWSGRSVSAAPLFSRLTLALLTVTLLISSSWWTSSVRAHDGASHAAPWEACEGEELGSACVWESARGIHRGSCRSVAGALLCVRHQPLVGREAPLESASLASPPAATPAAALGAVGLDSRVALVGASGLALVAWALRRFARSRGRVSDVAAGPRA